MPRRIIGTVLVCTLAIATAAAGPLPRVVAIGDIHGAGDNLIAILKSAGLVDAESKLITFRFGFYFEITDGTKFKVFRYQN